MSEQLSNPVKSGREKWIPWFVIKSKAREVTVGPEQTINSTVEHCISIYLVHNLDPLSGQVMDNKP